MVYWLIFCRIVLGLLFAISFIGKTSNITLFEQTIENFELLSKQFNRIAALLFMSGELVVILFLAIGGKLLGIGFVIAALLLCVFSIAIGSALARKIETTCNCLGPTKKPISYYDLWRNGGFILCALSGFSTLAIPSQGQANVSPVEWALVWLVAVVFVAAWTQIREIVKLFRQD
jgi:hypothetical protein